MELAKRYHDFSCGHRVVGHEGKCRHLHGHNYRIHFGCRSVSGNLDSIGRVIDFGEINAKLCMWLENTWDHRFLMWEKDPLYPILREFRPRPAFASDQALIELDESLVPVPFNPTAEEMARYLIHTIGPRQLEGTGVVLHRIVIEETRKCSFELEL